MGDVEKTAALKTNVYKKAHSALLLCLHNKLKKKLFTFYMHSSKKLSEHIEEFSKLIVSLTLEDVLSSLNSRELKKRTDAKDDGDGLYVRGRSDHRDNQGRGSPKKDCPKWNKKKSTNFVKNAKEGSGMQSEGYDNGNLLMGVSDEMFLEWIMNSHSSYHMTHRRDFLYDFKEFNDGTILLDDNRACAIRGTGKVHFIRHKNEAFSKFKEWKQLVENQTGRKLKKLRTDNGLEFCTQEFNNLGKDSGIARHLTVAGTPQQNGLAEQMNRTLLNKVSIYNIGEEVTYGFMVRTSAELRDVEDIWLDDFKPKIIISKDVVFNESLMYKDTLKGVGAADSGKEVEFENVDKEHDDEEPQQQNLDNYVLVHDKAKRTTTIPSGSKEEDDMVAYTFAIDEEEDTHEPITFWEEINSSEKDEVILSLTACEDYELEQLDVKTVFLHGNIKETIYMRKPPGFKEGMGNKIYDMLIAYKSKCEIEYTNGLLRKEFDMKELGLASKILGMEIVRDRGSHLVLKKERATSRNNYASCVYFKEFAPGIYIYLLVYVDDMLIACQNKSEIKYTNGLLQKEFDIKEQGPARKILGMEISVYVPLGAHFKVSLKDYPSSDWDMERMSKVLYVNVVDPNKGRSITGYMFMVHGYVVSWKATLQHVVALSTTVVEYMVLTKAVQESIWLKGLLIELGINLRSVVVNCDNQCAIYLLRNTMFHERTKHINVRYDFLRKIMKSKEVEVAKIGTKGNAADAFTKVVPSLKFKYAWRYLVSRITSLLTKVEIISISVQAYLVLVIVD
ncbi:retrovirus-related pol polyprotein from transposon TNT 1-94 [Tanacetum coccineum]